jgi:c-di-GMP-binding flagellar brake protein YcgR
MPSRAKPRRIWLSALLPRSRFIDRLHGTVPALVLPQTGSAALRHLPASTNRPDQGHTDQRHCTTMIADLTLDAHLAEPATDIHPDFAQRHPLQIAVCLRKLVSGQNFVTAQFGSRQIVTQVLDVDSRNARFVFDAGNVSADNLSLPSSKQLIFRSVPGGIRTQFTTGAAQPIEFDGRPAFEAPFPGVLYHVQRREFFRVQTPALNPYIASGHYADADSFQVELQDLSLGGVALKTADPRFGSLEPGCILRDVSLRLGDFGMLRIDVEIVAPRHSTNASGERRFVTGCKFVALPMPAERMLQRVITQLETSRQALLPRESAPYR